MPFRSLAAPFRSRNANFAAAVATALALASNAVAQAPWLPHPTAPRCDDRALADLDGDGDLDMVWTFDNIATLFVNRGNGQGGFGAYTGYTLATAPGLEGFVRCADLDQDGDADAVMAASVAWGDGAGGFAGEATIPWPLFSPHDPFHIADVDGNGTPDLVDVQSTSTVVLPLLAGGAFGAPVVSSGNSSLRDASLCDANNDGVLDVVTASDPQIGVRIGTGGGVFAPEQTLIAAGARKIASGDVDQDGAVDLCGFTGFQTDVLNVWVQPQGTFTLAHSTAYPISSERQLELVDIDVDGRLDVLLQEWRYVHVFAGLPGPSFAAGAPVFLGDGARGFRVGDSNLDGYPDLVGFGDESAIWIATQFWRFGGPGGSGGTHLSPSLGSIQGIAVGHFAQASGLEAVVEVNGGVGRELRWTHIDGSGSFTTFATTQVPAPIFNSRVARVDRDGDGRDELVRAAALAAFELYDAATPLAPVLSFPLLEAVSAITAADFDANGQEDLLVLGNVSGVVPIRFVPGGWAALPPIATSASGEHARAVALGDVGGTSAPDLVAVHPSGLVTWCVGNGSGTFGAPVALASVGSPVGVHVFDLDADGRFDVHVTSQLANGTLFSFLQPGGVFATTPIVIGCGAALELADIDLDGKRDLVTSGSIASSIVVRRGTHSASGFAPIPQEVYFNGGEAGMASVAAAEDVDGDGRVDLLLSNGVQLGLMLHRDYATPGTQSIGSGSAGCAGAHTWEALTQPILGNASFALRGDAAHANGAGLVLISAQADAQGSDPFQLGPLFHVGLAGVSVTGVHADAAGIATKHVPVPNDPALVAVQLSTQAVWAWTSGPCAPTQPLGLSSSPGLTLTFLP